MPRMLDLIRSNALSSHQMMTASKGALHVPAPEMVEILVYIAEHNKIFGGHARFTLAAWDEASAQTIVADPATPKEVLEYWLEPKNLRPTLFPLLLENPSVSLVKVAELATTLKGEWIDAMIASPRVRNSRQLQNDLASNKELSGVQTARIQELITGRRVSIPVSNDSPEPEPAREVKVENAEVVGASAPAQPPLTLQQENEPSDPEADDALVAFFTEHAAEINAEGDKPFQPIGGFYDEIHAEPETHAVAAAAGAASGAAPSPSVPALKPVLPKKLTNPEDEKRGSVLQKIARLDVKGRIQLAVKGTKEERAILVRDGTKIVALAVLDSPKISDGEVEKFATQKNVLEAVLRSIPMKRRFAKNYAVVRNLTFNPRTPLDVALGLMKNLLVQDLKHLSGNKEVSETVRKLALRMFKQRAEANNKK
jgi:hypothetical protein